MNQAFNPAFIDVSGMSNRDVQNMGHADEATPTYLQRRALPAVHPMAAELRAASVRFDARRDAFAAGKGTTCRDIADKLERFGSFVSEKQEQFAAKLVEWSKPRQWGQEAAQAAPGAPVAPSPAPAPVVRLERLFDLMQRLSKLTIGAVTIARKNQDSLCWVKLAGREGVFGKIENGALSLFWGRLHTAKVDAKVVEADLLRIEQDPEAAAVLHGKASGRCSICSRDLTDPVSIERGVGPICLGKAGW